MKRVSLIIILLSLIVFSFTDVYAKITVVSVTGKVAYKKGSQWQPISQGMELEDGVKISSGVNSTAVLQLNDNKLFIKPLTMMKIYENKKDDTSSTTKIALRRGSVRAQVSKDEKIKTIFKVSTPVATSSVRGTDESVSYGPGKGMQLRLFEGSAFGETFNGYKVLVSGNMIFNVGSNQPLPAPLLARIKKLAFGSVQDENITDDERHSQNLFGSDAVDNPHDSPDNVLNNNKARATVKTVWPN